MKWYITWDTEDVSDANHSNMYPPGWIRLSVFLAHIANMRRDAPVLHAQQSNYTATKLKLTPISGANF